MTRDKMPRITKGEALNWSTDFRSPVFAGTAEDQVRSRPSEHLSDPGLAERRARHLQISNEVRHEVGKPVDGLS